VPRRVAGLRGRIDMLAINLRTASVPRDTFHKPTGNSVGRNTFRPLQCHHPRPKKRVRTLCRANGAQEIPSGRFSRSSGLAGAMHPNPGAPIGRKPPATLAFVHLGVGISHLWHPNCNTRRLGQRLLRLLSALAAALARKGLGFRTESEVSASVILLRLLR
jgi:hypothetical protein